MRKLIKRKKLLGVNIICREVESLIINDENFRKNFISNPKEVLVRFGLSKNEALGVMLNAIEVNKMDISISHSCWFLSCWNSRKKAVFESLPALDDSKAWNTLLGVKVDSKKQFKHVARDIDTTNLY